MLVARLGRNAILRSFAPSVTSVTTRQASTSPVSTAKFREIYHNTDSVDGLYEKCRRGKDRYDPTKRAWHYMVVGTSAAIGVTAARLFIYRFFQYWGKAADTL